MNFEIYHDIWETLEAKSLLKRDPFVEVVQEKVRTSRDEIVNDYYRVRLPKFAACVAMTSDNDVITLWQYKHGPQRVSLTFPAGFIEEGEDPAQTCKRELLEETGFRPENLLALGSFVDGGNQEGSTGYYFLARNCKKVGEPDDSDLEIADLRLMTPEAVDDALQRGDIAIGHNVIAWLLAQFTVRKFT